MNQIISIGSRIRATDTGEQGIVINILRGRTWRHIIYLVRLDDGVIAAVPPENAELLSS